MPIQDSLQNYLIDQKEQFKAIVNILNSSLYSMKQKQYTGEVRYHGQNPGLL